MHLPMSINKSTFQHIHSPNSFIYLVGALSTVLAAVLKAQMSAVPPTPFVPSRLTEGLDEDSVLLAQQPIFEDFSLDETAFWDVPNLGESSRTHQKRPTSRSPSQVWTYDEPYRSLDDETMSLASLEGTVIIGSGERLTRTDEERGSDIGSTRRPMLMPSSSTTSSSKRREYCTPCAASARSADQLQHGSAQRARFTKMITINAVSLDKHPRQVRGRHHFPPSNDPLRSRHQVKI